MPATIVRVPTIDRLDEVVNKTIQEHQGKDIYVYFYASIDPETGVSWCPDCVAGKEALDTKWRMVPPDTLKGLED